SSEMQPATLPAVRLAIALLLACWAAPGLLAAASAADESARAPATMVREEPQLGHGALLATLGTWSEGVAAAAREAVQLLAAGYQRVPALVLAVSALLLLPAV